MVFKTIVESEKHFLIPGDKMFTRHIEGRVIEVSKEDDH